MLGNYSLENNVLCTLSAPISDSDTEFVLNEAVAPYRNPKYSGVPSIFTIVDNMVAPTKIEIVKVWSVGAAAGGYILVGDHATERGHEGTSAQAWSAGSFVFQSITSGMLDHDWLTYEDWTGYYMVAGHMFATTHGVAARTARMMVRTLEAQAAEVDHLKVRGNTVLGSTKIDGKLGVGLSVAPSSSSDAGEQGEIRITSNYIYVCVGMNNWKRVALSSF